MVVYCTVYRQSRKRAYVNREMKPWQFELEEYIREGEPSQVSKANAWQTAIGLQDVDRLQVSDYLIDTAKKNIEGKIDTPTARQRIENYYKERHERGIYESETEEADIVAQRASELLMDTGFQFSPTTLLVIHKHLFESVFDDAGEIRHYNISKKEWVLRGESVRYASYTTIWDSLKYDFDLEKEYSYRNIPINDAIKHIAKFISGIWQIHPFSEGNTRSTAIFAIKYLNSMGFEIDNTAFEENSWYFRNALVRANYENYPNGINPTTKPLELFFDNLLLGTHHELKNRFLHVDYTSDAQGSKSQSATTDNSKCKICTLNCTLEEIALLKHLIANPQMTQKELAAAMKLSERTIKTRTTDLQNRNLLTRENGKRNGRWIVTAELED